MRRYILAFTLAALPLSGQAATLNVDNAGILLGARDVAVDGALYDVTFENGTCASSFDGCNEASDFAFNDVASATRAAAALLDQVFVDGPLGNFDSQPALTKHCTVEDLCVANIPYEVFSSGASVTTAAVLNYNSLSDVADGTGYSFPSTFDLAPLQGFILARFSQVSPAPVPLPAAGWLMVAGLGALAASGRSKKSKGRA